MLGEFAEREAAAGRLFAFGLAAAIGIFLLLQTCIGSWRVATFSFLTLPLALVGGLLAAFAAGGVISLGSLVGFLTVFGIAARNGILLINHYQHLEREEGQPFGIDLVAARLPRATRADPDDRACDRPRARAARDLG